MAVKIGGEGSSIDTRFLDAYKKIAGEGKSAQEQIENIQNSVENKIATSQNKQDQSQLEGRRQLGGIDKTLADVGELGENLSTGAGDFIFGEDSGDELETDFLKFAGRSIVNLPGSTIGSIPYYASSLGSAVTGTDYTYYDPETATVPEGEEGELTGLGRASNALLGAAGLFTMGKGAALPGRVMGAAKGAAGGAAVGKITGTGAAKGALKGAVAGSSGKKGIANIKPRGPLREAYENFGDRNFGTRALLTAGEEGLQEAFEESLEWTARTDDSILRGEVTEEQWGELGKGVAYGAVGGVIGGGFMGGIQGGINQATRNARAEDATASDSNNERTDPSYGKIPDSYFQIPDEAIQSIIDNDKPEPSKSGQNATIYSSFKYGINEGGLGQDILASLYMTDEGMSIINEAVGEENQSWVEDAILSPREYVSNTSGSTGKKAAKQDLNALFNSLGPNALLFKYPATGKQILISITGIEDGTGLWLNGDIAPVFNGDFDTDQMGVEISEKAMTDSAGDIVKIRPSQLLASEAVNGKSLIDADHTVFSPLVRGDKAKIKTILGEAGLSTKDINQFIKNYEIEGNEAKIKAVTRLFSFEGKDLSNDKVKALWETFRKYSRSMDRNSAEAIVAQTEYLMNYKMSRSAGSALAFEGTVNNKATTVTAQVKIGRSDPTKTGPALRSFAELIWGSRRTKDQVSKEEIRTVYESALAKLCNDELNILQMGETPLNLIIELYQERLRIEVRNGLNGRQFKNEADFVESFVDIANKLRTDFEASQYYDVLGEKQLYKGFTGFTDKVQGLQGGIVEFARTFGSNDFSEFFNAPESYNNKTVSQVFTQVAESRNGYTDAFVLYGEEQSNFNHAAANSHSRSGVKISEEFDKVVNTLFEGDARLEVENDIVTDKSMATLMARYKTAIAMLRDSVAPLNMSHIKALWDWSDEAYHALIGKNKELFKGLILSLKFSAETMPLQARMIRYSETKNSIDYKRMRAEAEKLATDSTPVYRLTAAQILDTKEGEDIDSSIFDTLMTLYHDRGDKTLHLDTLEKFLGAYYDMGDYGKTLGSLAADILCPSDDVTLLSQTRYDFTIAANYAKDAAMSSEAYHRRNFNNALSIATRLGYNTNQFIDALYRISGFPVLIDEVLLGERAREGSFTDNHKKDKANDSPYAVLTDEGMLKINLGGRINANDQMFDMAANTVDADAFYASRSQLRELIWGPPDTQITLKTNYGKGRKTITKVEFFKELTGVEWNESGNHADQILTLLQMNPKIGTQLGISQLTVSITGSTTISKAEDLSDSFVKDYLERPEQQREDLAIAAVKSVLASDMRAVEVTIDMMRNDYGKTLPYTNSTEWNRLFKKSWNELARLVYEDVASLDGLSPEMASLVARHNQSAQHLTVLRDLLLNNALAKEYNNYSLANNDEILRGIKQSLVFEEATAAYLGEDNFLMDIETNSSFVIGPDVSQIAQQQTLIAKMNAAITIYEQTAAYDAIPPERLTVIDLYKKSLPTKGKDPIHFEAMRDQAKAEGFTGNMTAYKQELQKRFAKYYTDDVHNATIAKTDMSYEPGMDILRLPKDFQEANDEMIASTIKDSGLVVAADGINKISALIQYEKLQKEQKKITKSFSDKLRKLAKTRDANIHTIENVARLTPQEQADAIAKENAEYERKKQEKELVRDIAIRKKVQDPWETLRLAIVDAELSDALKRLNVQGDPFNTETFSDLERLQLSFLDLVKEVRDNSPDGVTFSPLQSKETDLTRRKPFVMPKMYTLDPDTRKIAGNVRMSMRGGTTPGGVSNDAQGTGWMGAYGEAGEYARCEHPGNETTLEEALTHPDVTLIQTPDKKMHHFASANQMAKTNLILESDPDTPVLAFYKGDCLCSGICMNHSNNPKNNWSTDDNAVSTFSYNLSIFMQEINHMKQKKNLSPSDIKRLFVGGMDLVAELQPKYVAYTPGAEANIQQNIDDFRNAWIQSFQKFINNELNGAVPGEAVDVQDMLLDLDFAIDIGEFCTRFTSMRVKLPDGTTFEEYNNSSLTLKRAAELTEQLEAAGIQAEIEISPMMISIEDSAYASIRYANAKTGEGLNRPRLLTLGFQDPGHRIKVTPEGLSTTDAYTFTPGEISLTEAYGRMSPQKKNTSTLPPSVDQNSPYMNYIKKLFGQRDLKRPGYSEDGPQSTVQLNPNSYQELRQIMPRVLKNDVGNMFVLVNKVTNPEKVWDDLANVSDPSGLSGQAPLKFGLSMPRIHLESDTPDGNTHTPAIVMDNTDGGIKFEQYRDWALDTYDTAVSIFVAKGQNVPAKYSIDQRFRNLEGYDAYVVYPTMTKDIGANGFRLAPQPVQSHLMPVVGGDQADASIVFPKDLDGLPFTYTPTAYLDVKSLLKNREDRVTWVAGAEQALVKKAWDNSMLAEEDRDPTLPTIDIGEKRNKGNEAISRAMAAWNSASLSLQGMRNGAMYGDIIGVLKLPGDVVEYKPIFLEDLPALGSNIDTFTVTNDESGAGFRIRGSWSSVFTAGVYKKVLGFWSSYKGTGTVAWNIGDTLIMSNGQGAIELTLADLQKKTEQTQLTDDMLFWAAYQMPKKNNEYRHVLADLDENGVYKFKPTINQSITSDPQIIDLLSRQDSIEGYKIFEHKTLKEGEYVNQEGEELFRRFIKNVSTTPGVSPNKYLATGFNGKDGKADYVQYKDDALSMIFHNFTHSDKLKFWNYVTDGELCPFGTNGELVEGMILNSQLEKLDGNGEYQYWGVQDGLFNFEDSSDRDLPSSAGVVIGTSQSSMSANYSTPAVLDFRNLVKKQSTDTGDYGPMTSLEDKDTLNELIEKSDRSLERGYSQKTQTELVFDDLVARKAVNLTYGSGFWSNWSKSMASVRHAFLRPVKIHDLDNNGNKVPISSDQMDNLLERIWTITGQDTYKDPNKKMTRFNLRQLLSTLISYSDIPGKNLDSISLSMANEVIENYAKTLDPSTRSGQFPRMEWMWKASSDETEWRYGMIGNKAMMELEWSFPAVQNLFSSKQEFLESAGKFQQQQSREIVNVPGAAWKRSALEAYQLYLQSDYRGVIDVGNFDPVDPDGKMAANEIAICEALGIDPGDAVLKNIIASNSRDYLNRIEQINKRDARGRKTRKQKPLKDEAGNAKPPRQDQQASHGSAGSMLDKLLGARIGNSLVANLPITLSAIGRTVGGGFIMRQADRFRWLLGEKGIVNQGVQPSDFDLIVERSTNGLLQEYARDYQMVSAWGEPAATLEGYFTNPDATRQKINKIAEAGGWAKSWQRLGGRFASGFGIGQHRIISGWILRMGMYMGDTEWLSNQTGQEVLTPYKTQEEWETILSSDDGLYDFLAEATHPDSEYNVIMRAAMQDAQRATQARQNGVYQLFRSLLRSMPGGTNVEKAFSVFVYPFMNYAINVTAWASNAIYAFPSETLFYALHHNGNKLQQYLHANGIENELIDRIDWQMLDSGRGIKEALLRDAVRWGGFQLLAVFAAGLLPVDDPEKDELKDEWTEYRICGMRIASLWPLSDMIGPIGPLIVYQHTVQTGSPRPDLLWNGFYDITQNGAVTRAESFMNALNDPLAWLDDISDYDMAYLNGENPEEYSPEQAALNGFFLQGVGGLYTIAVPSFIDDVFQVIQHDSTAPSSNFIYEVDDSGKPTGRFNEDTGQYYLERAKYDDIQWRRMTRSRPFLGLVTDIFTGSGFAGEGTGYMGDEMPNIVRYEPYQIASAKIYEIIGDEEHDSQVAADVIYMLASYDDMDELTKTGFYINAETRFYVGRKIWDTYWSYQYQIDEAKAMGLNDYYALGNGDYLTGQKVWQTWLNDMNSQKQFYYDLYHNKLDSQPLRTRMLTANMMQQSYGTDSAGVSYGTGYPNSNPWALVAIGSQNNAGPEGGYSSVSPLTDLPVGERGWMWNTANSYYDSTPFESFAQNEDGEGFSDPDIAEIMGLESLATLADAYNPAYSKSSSGYSYSRSGGGGGGGYGGGSSMPKLYSNPQDVNADSASIARLDRLSDSQIDYIRPDWETKGSREAYRRGDI